MDLPEEFLAGLAVDPNVLVRFDKLPSSRQREYVEFYLEANNDETRNQRMAKILAMLSTE